MTPPYVVNVVTVNVFMSKLNSHMASVIVRRSALNIGKAD